MLKIIALLDLVPKTLGVDDNKVIGGNTRANETFKNLSKSKILTKSNFS